jgi:hypothetical protein
MTILLRLVSTLLDLNSKQKREIQRLRTSLAQSQCAELKAKGVYERLAKANTQAKEAKTLAAKHAASLRSVQVQLAEWEGHFVGLRVFKLQAQRRIQEVRVDPLVRSCPLHLVNTCGIGKSRAV